MGNKIIKEDTLDNKKYVEGEDYLKQLSILIDSIRNKYEFDIEDHIKSLVHFTESSVHSYRERVQNDKYVK